MNRLVLFIILLSPTVAASWMLLPRYYSSLFGPSLFDTMFMTPSLLPSSSTMVPKVTESNSLWNRLMDESYQMQQRMMSLSTMSPSYEYKNYDSNITIRTHLPSTMTFENVQVQYDEPNQLLWIRGSNDNHETVNTNSGESKATTTASEHDKKDVSTATMKSMSHYEFTQTFALDPNIVNMEHLTASYDDNTRVLTVVVPKYEQIDDSQKKPALRTIPIATTTTAGTTSLNGATMNTTTTTTAPSEVNEPVMTH